jgi:hypothetical protein
VRRREEKEREREREKRVAGEEVTRRMYIF